MRSLPCCRVGRPRYVLLQKSGAARGTLSCAPPRRISTLRSLQSMGRQKLGLVAHDLVPMQYQQQQQQHTAAPELQQ